MVSLDEEEKQNQLTSGVIGYSGTNLDALLYGSCWRLTDSRVVSFGFPVAQSAWDGYNVGSEPYSGFISTGETVADAARYALSQWSSVANLGFIEVDETLGNVGTLRIGFSTFGMSDGLLGYTYALSESPSAGDVWLNANLEGDFYSNPVAGTLAGFVLLHELGHALGLKHPHSSSSENGVTLASQDDTIFNTVESYFIWPKTVLTKNSIDRLPTTPMALDIDALQFLYGENFTARSGDDVYSFNGSGKYLETIYDTGGEDTIQVSGSRNARIDLRPDAWSEIGIPVQVNGGAVTSAKTVRTYKTTCIENAKGDEGRDTLIGNDAGNKLWGNRGADVIVGNGGDDSIDGGPGKDRMAGGAGADAFVFSNLATGGYDCIYDFSEEDTLIFSTAVFSSLVEPYAGNFAYDRGQDADDYLIYKSGTRSLFYDADGAGKEFDPVKIVVVKGPDARTFSFDDMGFI